MMNHHRAQPSPGPDCAAVAPLVEQVVGQKRLHPEDESLLQAHLEMCMYCRAELDSYRWLDEALARHFAPPTRDPLSPGEVSAIVGQNYRPRSASPTRPARPDARGTRRPLPHYEEPRKRRGHRLISVLSTLAAVLLIAVVGLAIFISHTHSPGAGKQTNSTSATPSATLPPISEVPYAPRPKDALSSIYMVSADEGWAVGSSFLGAGQRDTIILHYTGGQWKQVMGAPNDQQLQAGYIGLSQVVMVSATEGWAVGNLEDYSSKRSGLILHYTGGRWRTQEVIPNIELFSLAMVSASEGWAVGDTPYGLNPEQQGVVLHYTGGAWKQVPGFGNVLSQVTMTSPVDGWITGILQPGTLSAWHYNGSAWTLANIPVIDYVGMISPVSANDVWAVGAGGAAGGASNAKARLGDLGQMVFAHYDGKTWTAVQTPIAGQNANINSLFMDSSNDGWAIGNIATSQVSEKMVYLHYTGGKWVEVNGPDKNGQYTLFMLSASEGWAVGDNATILHYHNGAWSVALGG